MMDWFQWLSKSTLDPSLVYEYGLLLSNNELEEADIAHFDHDFLRSMGISIAKHRLQILLLAGKLRRRTSSSLPPVTRLLAAIKRTQKLLQTYLYKMAAGEDRSSAAAIVVVPRASYSTPSRAAAALRSTYSTPSRRTPSRAAAAAAALKRDKKMMMVKHGRVMITDGGVFAKMPAHLSNCMSPMLQKKEHDDDDDGYWGITTDADKVKWVSMFGDMKPT